jgi:hypothetical protein
MRLKRGTKQSELATVADRPAPPSLSRVNVAGPQAAGPQRPALLLLLLVLLLLLPCLC